jgi:hypothetical protein
MTARRVFTVLALVFFFTPVTLRVVGVHAHAFENRPLATIPHLSQGWQALPQATQFLVDRLPLREQAVRANTWGWEHIFGTAPNYGAQGAGALPFGKPDQPKVAKSAGPANGSPANGQPGVTVLEGKKGWLFLEDELGRACNLFTSWKIAMARWTQMVSIIRRSGRKVVLVIPPDKSTIYPEYLPDRFPERDCIKAGRTNAWRAIESSANPGILGLRQPLLNAKKPPPEELYFPTDTHWNTMAGVLAVQATLERLGSKVRVEPDEILKDRTSYTGDLSNLQGKPVTGTAPRWQIRRAGLPAARAAAETLPGGGKGTLIRRRSGGPPVLPGRTVFVDDSYGEAMIDALQSYTHQLSIVQWYVDLPPASLIASIKQADTVILESIERDINYKASDGAIVTPQFLAALARALPPR